MEANDKQLKKKQAFYIHGVRDILLKNLVMPGNHMLSETKLNFLQAHEIALIMESADKNVSDIAAHSSINIH